jgi:hypothetical protein
MRQLRAGTVPGLNHPRSDRRDGQPPRPRPGGKAAPARRTGRSARRPAVIEPLPGETQAEEREGTNMSWTIERISEAA